MTGKATLQANLAAEAVRGLNYASQPCTGELTTVPDVYDVLGALELLSSRLPQALSQLHAFLAREHAAGRVRVMEGHQEGDAGQVLIAVFRQLDIAAGAAESLRAALASAHEESAWLSSSDHSA